MVSVFSILEVEQVQQNKMLKHKLYTTLNDGSLIHYDSIKTVEMQTYKTIMHVELHQENFDKVDNYTQKVGDEFAVRIKTELSNQKWWESYH